MTCILSGANPLSKSLLVSDVCVCEYIIWVINWAFYCVISLILFKIVIPFECMVILLDIKHSYHITATISRCIMISKFAWFSSGCFEIHGEFTNCLIVICRQLNACSELFILSLPYVCLYRIEIFFLYQNIYRMVFLQQRIFFSNASTIDVIDDLV